MPLLFSVITPAYNCANYLPEAIQSVINQTYTNWEMIIVDDGSTDNTLQIAQHWATKDKRIKVLQHKNRQNKGVSVSRNLAIQNAKGKWLALLDGDDVWYKEKLELEHNILQNNNEVVMLFSKALLTNEKGESLNAEYGSANHKEGELNFNQLINGFHAPTSGCLTCKNSLLKIGGFNENYAFSEDTLLFHQISEQGTVFFLNKLLSEFRQYHNSSRNNFTDKKKILARYEVYADLLEKVKLGNKEVTTKALINVGLKKILRNLYLIKGINIVIALKYLRMTNNNSYISNKYKFKAIFIFLIEVLIIPLKILNKYVRNNCHNQ